MSLSSLLLGAKTSVDRELESVFKKAAKPVAGPSSQSPEKKRKHAKVSAETAEVPSVKRSKLERDGDTPTAEVQKLSSGERKTRGKGKSKAKEVVPEADEDSEENAALEDAYASRPRAEVKDDSDDEEKVEEKEDDEESGSEASPPIHESLLNSRSKKDSSSRLPRQKYAPKEETPKQRDARTIFIGNLPLEVASKRPLSKQLQRHILSFLPSTKIESLRFRSVPFQAPTAKLPDDEENPSKPQQKVQHAAPQKEVRPQQVERAWTWRSKLDDKDEETVKKDEKKFLTSAQKKRIAFINGEFHSTADSVNAYVVFAHAVDPGTRPSNLPPPPPLMEPYEAAALAAEKCDGTLFLDRILRVDLVAKAKGDELSSNAKKELEAHLPTADPKLSVFVGNLDFASKEDDLRVFFEGLLGAERGLPTAQEEVVEGQPLKPATWVTRVRIVRDKDTQLGKGFAYVQFMDRECVDEVLAMGEDRLKFAKRKLRVQRCKTVPGSKVKIAQSAKHDPKAPKPRTPHVHVVVPKGDPMLGEKLAGLSKDERKQAKSTDADRVARRLAKKKARMAMGTSAPSANAGGIEKKDRERSRKSASQRKGPTAPPKAKSGRVRSEKSVSKRNLKK